MQVSNVGLVFLIYPSSSFSPVDSFLPHSSLDDVLNLSFLYSFTKLKNLFIYFGYTSEIAFLVTVVLPLSFTSDSSFYIKQVICLSLVLFSISSDLLSQAAIHHLLLRCHFPMKICLPSFTLVTDSQGTVFTLSHVVALHVNSHVSYYVSYLCSSWCIIYI